MGELRKDTSMGKTITRKRIVIAGVVVAFVLSFILPIEFSPWGRLMLFVIIRQEKAMQVRLLCKTNYQELLEACRELMRDDELMKPGMTYPVRGAKRRPEISRLPQPILDLEPSCVNIGDTVEYIGLEMAGGTNHFGVRAYPENFQKPFANFKYGDKELIPGLWYYDDGYHHNPRYGKKIEDLMQG